MIATTGGDPGAGDCCRDLFKCQLPFGNQDCGSYGSLDCTSADWYMHPEYANSRGCVYEAGPTYCIEDASQTPCLAKYACYLDPGSGQCVPSMNQQVVAYNSAGCSDMGCQ